MEAFTYYAHREKLALIGREGDVEAINRQALQIAKDVAAEHDSLFAGNICNTNVFDPDDLDSQRRARAMFDEQVGWAAEAGVDLVIGEDVLRRPGGAGRARVDQGGWSRCGHHARCPPPPRDARDGWSVGEACRRIEDAGADVVGLNCIRGPRTMLPLLEEVRDACDGHIAALPVPYRTTEAEPTFQSLPTPAAT